MPQLMPLMWMFSIFVVLLIFVTLVDLYYYKDEKVNIFLNEYSSLMIDYKW